MLTPKYYEQAPIEIEKLASKLQKDLITDIIRRIKKTGQITDTALYQLERVQALKLFDKDLEKLISQFDKSIESEVKSLFEKAGEESYSSHEELYKIANVEFVPYSQNEYIQQITEQVMNTTRGEMKNISKTLGFAKKINGKIVFDDTAIFFQDLMDETLLKVSTGSFSFSDALTQAVNKLVDSGLRTVDYSSGYSNRIDVAARRNIINGLKEMSHEQSMINGEKLGTDVYEISYHRGHRPSHSWGGLRYSLSGSHGLPTQEKLFADNGGGNLDDYNCYHDIYPTFPFSIPAYSKEQLKEYEELDSIKKEYDGKEYNHYEARQKQRQLERGMRKNRLKATVLKDNEEMENYKIVKARYRSQMAKYKDFSKTMGINIDTTRIYQDGLGRI